MFCTFRCEEILLYVVLFGLRFQCSICFLGLRFHPILLYVVLFGLRFQSVFWGSDSIQYFYMWFFLGSDSNVKKYKVQCSICLYVVLFGLRFQRSICFWAPLCVKKYLYMWFYARCFINRPFQIFIYLCEHFTLLSFEERSLFINTSSCAFLNDVRL